MRLVIQYFLLAAYAVIPVGMLYWALLRRRRGQVGPIVNVIFVYIMGIGFAVALLLIDGKLTGGRIPLGEQVRLIYMVIGALCLFRLIDRLVLRAIFAVARVKVDGFGRPAAPNRGRAMLSLLVQRVLVFGISLPYAIALLMVFRGRVVVPGDPSVIKLPYSNAAFMAADGVQLAGWWIPAKDLPDQVEGEAADIWGRRTVVLCHGAGSGKQQQLGLARLLAGRGFNVLAFDFRAHGDSGGNCVTYGDLERRDVLAAVKWVKTHHAEEAEKLFGVGVNTGAAALLAAAADERDGGNIDALVLFEPYARFDGMVAQTAGTMFPRVVAWGIRHISVPIAGFHAGSDLAHFAPVDYASRIWPRPVLLIHGRGIGFVPTLQEMELYQQLDYPKEQFWPADNYESARNWLKRHRGSDIALLTHMFRQWLGTHDPITIDPGAQYRLLRFLKDPVSRPVI